MPIYDQAVYRWRGRENIQTINSLFDIDDVELEFSTLPNTENESLKSTTRLFSYDGPFHIRTLAVGNQEHVFTDLEPIDPSRDPAKGPALKTTYSWDRPLMVENNKQREYLDVLISKRWQLLGENFLPKLVLSAADEPGDLYVVESNARNVPYIMDFMGKNHHGILMKI